MYTRRGALSCGVRGARQSGLLASGWVELGARSRGPVETGAGLARPTGGGPARDRTRSRARPVPIVGKYAYAACHSLSCLMEMCTCVTLYGGSWASRRSVLCWEHRRINSPEPPLPV